MRDRFEDMDINGDGRVSASEFRGPSSRFQQLDLNSDGYVNFEEARRARRGGERHEPDSRGRDEVSGGVVKSADIPYVEGRADPLQKLDIYQPTGDRARAGKLPVMVMIHGGGWAKGDKGNANMGSEKANFFARQGMVYVSVNYRLSPAVQHPEHVRDVASALAWIHDNIARYGGDPSQIMLMGHSSGAHLAALAITDDSYLRRLGKRPDIVKGVILLDGAGYDIPLVMANTNDRGVRAYEAAFGDNSRTWKDASPVLHVKPDRSRPPFLIFHQAGGADWRSDVQRRFAEVLNDAGTQAKAVPVRGKNHEEMNADVGKPGDPLTEGINDFIRQTLRQPALH